MERKSTLSTRTAREIRERDGRIEKKTEVSKSSGVKRANNNSGKPTETGLEIEIEKSRPYRHSYLVYTIFLGIKFLISGLNSLRGIAKTFEILSIHQAGQSPSFNTIRQWVLRLGLYELNRKKEYRTDWIFIVDMTIEIGKTKCLVILGIPQEKLAVIIEQEARSLQHKDVEVLSVEILDTTVGTVIVEKLNNLAARVGEPIQIVSDRGSDIKKGIDLYIGNHHQTIATYDITHKMANLLKQELSENRQFQEFFQKCSLTRQRVQQTDLCFLSPPTQRAKSRYHNIDILISWAIKIISYEENQDFSAIDDTYILDREAYRLLRLSISADTIKLLKRAKPEAAENLDKFSQTISNILTVETWQIEQKKICQATSLGRRKFYEKLGWLFSYRTDIQTYSEMLALINSVQTQIKNRGLHHQSLAEWLKSLAQPLTCSVNIQPVNPRVQEIQARIESYLGDEVRRIPAELILLGTSDVIESLFGKYKIFAQRRPIKEIGASILLIPLSTIEITLDLVKEAMESISFIDVVAWAKSIFGSSMLSRRRSLNSAANSDIKPA